jgi:hypothetical protein
MRRGAKVLVLVALSVLSMGSTCNKQTAQDATSAFWTTLAGSVADLIVSGAGG